MQIRCMDIADYSGAYSLWQATPGIYLRELDDSRAGIEFFLRRNPGTNFVAVEHSTVVATALCGTDGRRGYIYHVAVRKEYRKQGIARAMIDRVLEALHKEGIRKAALVVMAANEDGNAFWEKIGFTERHDLAYRDRSLQKCTG